MNRQPRLYWSDVLAQVHRHLPVEMQDELAAFLARQREALFGALCQARRFPYLVTLNCGMGRDSIAMLCLLAEGRLLCEGQVLRPVDVDAVVFSDTGTEWPFTYALVPEVRAFCARMGVPFYVLAKPTEYGARGWRDNPRGKGDRSEPAWVVGAEEWSIEARAAGGVYHRRIPIAQEFMRFAKIAVTVNSSCTDNHKVQPIRRWLSDLCERTFGIDNRSWGVLCRKQLRQRHRVLIGIAADEASRAINTGRPSYEWTVYPLLEAGIKKADEAEILARHGFDLPNLPVRKSGCFICPYQPVGWYWVLRELYPRLWKLTIEYEAAALAKNPKMTIVKGKPIAEAVEAWRERNPRATYEAVLSKSYDRCAPATTPDRGEKTAGLAS